MEHGRRVQVSLDTDGYDRALQEHSVRFVNHQVPAPIFMVDIARLYRARQARVGASTARTGITLDEPPGFF